MLDVCIGMTITINNQITRKIKVGALKKQQASSQEQGSTEVNSKDVDLLEIKEQAITMMHAMKQCIQAEFISCPDGDNAFQTSSTQQ